MVIIYLHIDPVWSLFIIGTSCTLGRAPRTKENLPDFHEWCRVTRHSRVFRGVDGLSTDSWILGVTRTVLGAQGSGGTENARAVGNGEGTGAGTDDAGI